jgi:hypothetical protein
LRCKVRHYFLTGKHCRNFFDSHLEKSKKMGW